MYKRQAVRAVEARLSAAGCPDADYDARELFRVAAGRDARLSDQVLTTEEAEKLETLCTRREQREPLQYLCGIWSLSLIHIFTSGEFVLDENRRVLLKAGQPIELTQVEFQIMELFFRNPGIALVREKIFCLLYTSTCARSSLSTHLS